MNWDNIYYKGRVIGQIIVFSEFIKLGTYRIAYSLGKDTSPAKAFNSRLVGTVYNCKSHVPQVDPVHELECRVTVLEQQLQQAQTELDSYKAGVRGKNEATGTC